MLPKLMPMMLFAALASCGARESAPDASKGGSSVDNATLAKLSLTSDGFKEGQRIPEQYSCDGAGHSPPLHWSDPPAGTKSFALVVDDSDAPGGTFRHWGVIDIPASARSIGGQSVGTEVINDFGKSGYGGPCPPRGHGPHHYHFKLFALDVGRLGLGTDAKVIDVETAAKKHAIGKGELIGTYERR
jgi:Raf kinase inhibitor-like YbhB/YbcL family protein